MGIGAGNSIPIAAFGECPDRTVVKMFREVVMNRILAIALAAGVALTAVAPAMAADGCGRGFHRGPHGHCHPNGGPGPVVAVGPSIGVFYAGRGYWDGNRYWQHRDRYHNGWRYR
jgi:hypothetical protein